MSMHVKYSQEFSIALQITFTVRFKIKWNSFSQTLFEINCFLLVPCKNLHAATTGRKP